MLGMLDKQMQKGFSAWGVGSSQVHVLLELVLCSATALLCSIVSFAFPSLVFFI